MTEQVFAYWWGVLCNRYGREVSTGSSEGREVLRLYFDAVHLLSEEDFIYGVKSVMRSDQFFPTPDRLVEAALRVDEVFQLAVNAVKSDGSMNGFNSLPGDVQVAFRSRSGLWRSLVNADNRFLEPLKREFVAAWLSVRGAVPLLEERGGGLGEWIEKAGVKRL